MLQLFLEFVKRVVKYTNRVNFAFEWPRLVDGWKLNIVQQLREYLPFTGEFDGCCYGLCRTDNDMLLNKPWRVITSSEVLARSLHRRCDHSHQHGECRGLAAEQSGLYNNRLVNIFVNNMLRS